MKKIFCILIAALFVPSIANAEILERRAARLIRQAGHWCDRVSDIRYDQQLTAGGAPVVRVTCDDGTRYVQYRLELNRDNTVKSIKEIK
ncbi:MAG: hypothetical protein ACRECW_10595 [Phyllobacterium sp.]